MKRAAITGTGLYLPPYKITNQELVDSYNQYVKAYEQEHAAEIAAGLLKTLPLGSVNVIEQSCGVRSRNVVEKDGILDINEMRPKLRLRGDDEPSIMCEMSIAAAKDALAAAGRTAADVDCVIAACSSLPRPYPALAVEIQHHLGTTGYGCDLNVACASAVFAIQMAVGAIAAGTAKCVLIVNPEICSAQIDFRSRDTHFIFGDACTALVVESVEDAIGGSIFEIVSTLTRTKYSSNVRSNQGFLNRCEYPPRSGVDTLFKQNSLKLLKEIVPIVSGLIADHLAQLAIPQESVRRFWLHQATLALNRLIAQKLIGREPNLNKIPEMFQDLGNTSSAGAVISFHSTSADFKTGEVGLMCAFGGGYSAGSAILRRV
jgi:beta-ketodecanoyl-[acyl-carrier-protein] synthase